MYSRIEVCDIRRKLAASVCLNSLGLTEYVKARGKMEAVKDL